MKLVPLPALRLQAGYHQIDLSQPQVMGILNVTPDSFSDGGHYQQLDQAIARAEQMLNEGATILDIGGESTRPGAQPVTANEELRRVVPVVDALVKRFDCIISVDTSSPEVFKAASDVGAVIWNDVRALTRPGAREMAAALQLPVILMHHRGDGDSNNRYAHYDDLMHELIIELRTLADAAEATGVKRQHILIDPGFGFAKQGFHNLALLNQLWRLQTLPYPLLIGLSRKRFLGEILADAQGVSAPVTARLHAGVAAALLAVQQGVSLIRTHDVKPTCDAIKLWQATQNLPCDIGAISANP